MFKKSVLFLLLCAIVTTLSAQLTGGDRDRHGCIGSAGYTWSSVRRDCIRVWEEGTRLNNTRNPKATSSAFIVMAPDSTRAEIFLPTSDRHPILVRKGLTWSGKKYRAERKKGKWSLWYKKALIYRQ